MNTIFVNGQAQTTVSALDRGILYGDSVFETVALIDSQILQLPQHLERLAEGLNALAIKADINKIHHEIEMFLQQINDSELLAKSVLRITITRGEQSRGYKPLKGASTTRILSLHQWPDYQANTYTKGLNIGISEVTVSEQPQLAKLKHGNRLEQVLAATQLPDTYDDAFMLNQAGDLISATKGNVFIKRGNQWQTPIIDRCGIEGVTRNAIIHWFQENNIDCLETRINANEILGANNLQSAFICNSILGLTPINTLLEKKLPLDGIKECLEIRNSLVKQLIIAA